LKFLDNMGILSFLRKRKKEEFLPAPTLEKLELGIPEIEKKEPTQLPSLPSLPPPITEPSFKEFTAPQKDISKDIELISAKLDTIKSMIENLSHRIEKLEQQKKETIRW